MLLDQREDSEQLARIRQRLGFDQPMGVQYLYFLNDLSPLSWHSQKPDHYTHAANQGFTGKALFQVAGGTLFIKYPWLRTSFQKQGQPVSTIIAGVLGNTMVLAFSAMALAIVAGLLLGLVSALLRDSWFDRAVNPISTAGMALPSFFSALPLGWIFGFFFGIN